MPWPRRWQRRGLVTGGPGRRAGGRTARQL